MKGPRAGKVVVVVGAGAAGMAAALAAARAGAPVWLLEAAAQVGGTVANCLIHTLGGIFDSQGEPLNDGLSTELTLRLSRASGSVQPRRLGRVWVLNVCPRLYRRVVERWLRSEARITVLCKTRVVRLVRDGGRVVELDIANGRDRVRFEPRAVIDTTGTAAVVRLLDGSLVQRDPHAAAGGLIFRLRGVQPGALAFPKSLAVVRRVRSAAAQGELPPNCSHAWLDTGIHADEVFVKLFVPVAQDSEPVDLERTKVCALEEGVALIAFLRQLPDFSQAQVAQIGELGIRDGGRIRGEYHLTGSDVRTGRTFADVVCRCSWPIEYWDPQRGLSLEYLPDHSYYEIPLRSLKVKELENVFAAGKCLDADRFAHASARVAGSCWSMGEAVGQAAAAVKAGVCL